MGTDSLPLEVVKVAMSQTKDGVKLVLVIHPHDSASDVAELFGHPVGTRYMAALVRVQEDETPVARPDHYVADAGKLCRNPLFQRYLVESFHASTATEDDAVSAIYRICGIQSRLELTTNLNARRLFDEMRMAFSRSHHG